LDLHLLNGKRFEVIDPCRMAEVSEEPLEARRHEARERSRRLGRRVPKRVDGPARLEKFFAEFGDPVPTRTSPAPELSDAEREERVRTAIAKAPEYGMGFLTPPPDAEG
jgi:hypothetical protein